MNIGEITISSGSHTKLHQHTFHSSVFRFGIWLMTKRMSVIFFFVSHSPCCFKPIHSSSTSHSLNRVAAGSGACPSWHWAKAGDTLDKLPDHPRADIERQTYTHNHTYEWFWMTNLPWTWLENMQTTHIKAQATVSKPIVKMLYFPKRFPKNFLQHRISFTARGWEWCSWQTHSANVCLRSSLLFAIAFNIKVR